MVNGTAINWHGMYQNGTNRVDGAMGITQCLTPPGQSFTYNYTVSNQWGTYWCHAHASSQYIDGIVGPFIIHSPDEPHLNDYQEEVITMISDHYHTDSRSLVSWYMSEDSEDAEPIPDNGLVNDRMPLIVPWILRPTSLQATNAHQELHCQYLISSQKPPTEFVSSILERSRISNFRLTISSVLVYADQTADNYWVRATMNLNCFNNPNDVLDEKVKAIIHYKGAPSIQQTNSTDWTVSGWTLVCIDLTLDMLKPYFTQPPLLQMSKSISHLHSKPSPPIALTGAI
ncbi:hypothetical protein BGX27_006814 [Mortierella sp. AM989]|nr:hypothetical protein BGX27_006814 [Mortierella sp. AM989]